jgi:hypothetical protein
MADPAECSDHPRSRTGRESRLSARVSREMRMGRVSREMQASWSRLVTMAYSLRRNATWRASNALHVRCTLPRASTFCHESPFPPRTAVSFSIARTPRPPRQAADTTTRTHRQYTLVNLAQILRKCRGSVFRTLRVGLVAAPSRLDSTIKVAKNNLTPSGILVAGPDVDQVRSSRRRHREQEGWGPISPPVYQSVPRQRGLDGHGACARGSMASCKPSPRKLNAITVTKISRPG